MKTSNHLAKYAIVLGLGFAIGAGTANFFADGGNAGKVTVPSVAKAPEAHAPVAAMNPPKRLAADPVPAEDGVNATTLLEDITLSEPTDTIVGEVAAAEPSPEELMKSPPPQRLATERISLTKTEELESTLRQESENAPPRQTEGNEALLEHERP
jgi:hypothetical protein